MLLKLKFLELHTPLFLGGRNFGVKLDTNKYQDVNLAYDRSEKEVVIEYNGMYSLIPTSNVVSMQPIDVTFKMPPKEPLKSVKAQQPVNFVPVDAQVSTPAGFKK